MISAFMMNSDYIQQYALHEKYISMLKKAKINLWKIESVYTVNASTVQ